jgi:glutathione S-transferase
MPAVYHIPVCPFSQRLEILLELKGLRTAVTFNVVDITKPRSPELLAKTRGSTALPVLETDDGQIVKESLVILRYLEDVFPKQPVAQADPYRRAVENMMIAMEADFAAAGYRFLMNQDVKLREQLAAAVVTQFRRLDDFLTWQSPQQTFLFENYGLAEAVFTPLFMRFWFLEYYEDFEMPGDLKRLRHWHDACISHPAAQQVSREEIVKLYYDYALGAGNGALPTGRRISSFAFEPDWRKRPWPPQDKWARPATDDELGLS